MGFIRFSPFGFSKYTELFRFVLSMLLLMTISRFFVTYEPEGVCLAAKLETDMF